MRIIRTLILCCCCLGAQAQKVNIKGVPKIIRDTATWERYMVVYFPGLEQYMLCDGDDKTLKKIAGTQKIWDDCECENKPDLPTAFNDLDSNFLEKFASLRIDKSKNEWSLVMPESLTISGDNANNYAFLERIIDNRDPNNYSDVTTGPENTCSLDHVDTSEVRIIAKKQISLNVVVGTICNTQKLRPNFKTLSAVVNGASAVFYKRERYILYNDKYLLANVKKTHTKWTYYYIFAHEIAHHLNGDMLDTPNITARRTYETDADRWAGRTLHLMGAPRSKALAWVRKVPPVQGDQYYPSRKERINAVKQGWKSTKFPLTSYYWLSAGVTAGRTKDELMYQSFDFYVHPPIGDFLPHFALGINYSPLDLDQPIADDIPVVLFTAKAYLANYFKSSFNGSISYTRAGDDFQLLRIGMDYKAALKRVDFEVFAGTNRFTIDEDEPDAILIGASVHYCFFNKNNIAPKVK